MKQRAGRAGAPQERRSSGKGLLVGVLLGFAAGLAAAQALPRAQAEGAYSALDELSQVLYHVERDYIRPLPPRWIVHKAISGLLSSLDEHSAFYPKEESERLRASMTNTYGGLGLELRKRGSRLTVVRVLPGSPAARAGLRPPLLLLEIEGEPCSTWSPARARRALMGQVGTSVRLLLGRPDGTVVRLRLERQVIRRPVVEARWAASGVLWLHLRKFAPGTTSQVRKALESATGLQALLLDLRGNPGGLVSEAISVADLFLDRGIVAIRKTRRTGTARFQAHRDTPFRALPLVVLVDGKTASAAELLAAGLHENGRAALVGEKTYGKGTIQEFVTLRQGSLLLLTVGEYLTPKGRLLEKTGITPPVAPTALLDPRPYRPYDSVRNDTWITTALAVLARRNRP